MNLRHLQVFHAIMRTGSITSAARMLNLTQPAVSTALKHFEGKLRIRLFTRTGGRLQPTPEAEAIYPSVVSMYERLDAVDRLVQDLAGGRLGSLSIAASFTIANGYLAKAVASFIADRPRTRVALESMSSARAVEHVVDREAELGVVYEPVSNPEVETEVLLRSGISCVMRNEHPLARRREIDVRELATHPLITYLPQAPLRAPLSRALDAAGVVPNIAIQVSLSFTGVMMAYHGAGIAIVEPYLLEAMPLPGLVIRPLRPRVELKVLLVRRKTAPRSGLMDSFVLHLKKTARNMPGH
jgi:DNA-binding transcriptional LysR family regulator